MFPTRFHWLRIICFDLLLCQGLESFVLNTPNPSRSFQEASRTHAGTKKMSEEEDPSSLILSVPENRFMSRSSFLAFGVASIPIVAHASSNAKQESLSGFVAGASLTVTKTLVKYPLDTATVRLQMPTADYSLRNPVRLFRGSYDGVFAPLLANIPAGAVFFAVKDATKAALSASTDTPRWLKTCLAVAAAQGPYWLVRNPSEVVKTRQQARVEGYDGIPALQAYQYLIGQTLNPQDSLKVFYTGYWENILYAYPADVLKFVCYEQLTGGGKPTPAEGALAGAVATAIAQYFTTPLDVVRNRVMAGGEATGGYWESLVKLAKAEGYDGLFAGATPRIGKAILSGAIQFATYEETKRELSKFFTRGTQARGTV